MGFGRLLKVVSLTFSVAQPDMIENANRIQACLRRFTLRCPQ